MQRALALAFSALTFALPACASRAGPPPSGSRPESAEDLEQAATSLYHRAYKTHDRGTYEAAVAAFERALAERPDTPHAYEMIFYDAEARYEISDWTGAAERYRRAIALQPRGAMSLEAAYAYVLATRRAHGLREGDPDPRCPDDDDHEDGERKAAPLPEETAPLLVAYDLYLSTSTMSDDPARSQITFRKARILYSCGHLADAEPLFAEIVDRCGTTPEAGPSAAMLLDCLAGQGKREALFARADALEQGPLAHDPSLVEVLERVREARKRR